jgi:hypothetical protein
VCPAVRVPTHLDEAGHGGDHEHDGDDDERLTGGDFRYGVVLEVPRARGLCRIACPLPCPAASNALSDPDASLSAYSLKIVS